MTLTDKDVRGSVRTIISEHAGLRTAIDALSDSDDLYAAGMTSHASVVLMIAIEDAFGVEFPDAMLTRTLFSNIESIAEGVETLLEGE